MKHAGINIFEGGRRLSLLLKVAWVACCAVFVFLSIPTPLVSLTYETESPSADFKEAAACGIYDAVMETNLAWGPSVLVTLCFKAHAFSGGEMLVPYSFKLPDINVQINELPFDSETKNRLFDAFYEESPRVALESLKQVPLSVRQAMFDVRGKIYRGESYDVDDIVRAVPIEQRKAAPSTTEKAVETGKTGEISGVRGKTTAEEPTKTKTPRSINSFAAQHHQRPLPDTRPAANKWIGDDKYSPNVTAYASRRTGEFEAKMGQLFRKPWWKAAINAAIVGIGRWIGYSIGGWIVFSIITAVIGWIVRGFLGIPDGEDYRPVAPTSPES